MTDRKKEAPGRPVMIRVENLRKKYSLGKTSADTLQSAIREWKEKRHLGTGKMNPLSAPFYALDGVDFTVCEGETLGIIGRNGAGKSTLLKILSRITAPTEGSVELYGRITSMLEVGTGFHGDMTGRENIYLNGAILGMSRAEIEAKMEDIIRFAEIEQFIDTPVKRYSSGMFVKLGFSVAFHLESEIVVMDEVLAVGDIAFQKKCMDHLAEAARKKKRTVLFVSHNMNAVRQLCDRCIVLEKGKILFDGDTDQAISVYLGTNGNLPGGMEFGPEYRPNDPLIRPEKRFTIHRMKVLGRSEPIYTRRDQAEIELTCIAEQKLERVGFRFEFWYQDGTKVASMLSENFLTFTPGESRILMTIPLSNLTRGQYRADLVAFQFDEKGSEYMIDAVYPGFQFMIKQVLDDEDHLDWHTKYWGAIRLSDMTLQVLEK